MRKKVVEGGPIRFREDLPIATAEIAKPLDAPPFAPLSDVLTVWYKARFFELDRAAGESSARIWDREYGLRETESAGAREERYWKDNEAAIARAQEEWLRRVLPGAELSGASRSWGAQVSHVVKDRIEELCAVPLRPPLRDVGKGAIRRSDEKTVLATMHGYERILQVDGKVYELLSLAEYLSRFEKAFEPKLLEELQKESEDLTPALLCERMSRSLDRMDKKTYGVIKGKLHHDRRTFELRLDGAYFVPEHLCAARDFVSIYRALIDKKLKIDAVNRLLS